MIIVKSKFVIIFNALSHISTYFRTTHVTLFQDAKLVTSRI